MSLAAVLGVLWLLQRRLSRAPARRREPAEAIRIIGRQSLGAKARLVVVEIDGARYVLGITDHGVSVVDRLGGAGTASAADVGRGTVTDREEGGAAPSDRILTLVPMPDAAPSVPRLRERHRRDPLKGSILSAETWRQSADALRRAR